MLIFIKGAGDLATGVALRLFRAGFQIVMSDLPKPTSIRRTVCFSEAIRTGSVAVEGVWARYANDPSAVRAILAQNEIAVLADPEAHAIKALCPPVVVDAILAKRNLGTSLLDAPAVIALGPGFVAGKDCHAVVETMRGHLLGRVYYEGGAIPNTGVPGLIGGYALERLLKAPCDGVFQGERAIGDLVKAGEIVARVDRQPMPALIDGVLRGLLPDGTKVTAGMKSGDIDPRGKPEYCNLVSDKALSVAGGVLEAVLTLTRLARDPVR